MKSLLYIEFSLFIFCSLIFAQEDYEIIATAGSVNITVEEFRNRFEFMPHLNYSNDNPDTLKKEFLYSLIAEKLWALEATQFGLDTLDNVKYSLKTLEKMLVKDELYKQEIESKIILTNKEIAEGIIRVVNLLKVNIIAVKDSADAIGIYNSLKNVADFDSLANAKHQNQEVPIEITLGKLREKYLEDILYSLNPGEISEPVNKDDGWFIFKLKEISKNPAIDPASEQARNIAIKLLRERKERELAGKFIDSIIGGKTYTADKKLFNLFADQLISGLKNKLNSLESDSTFNYQLNEVDILSALNAIKQNDLAGTFISFEDEIITLKDFIYYLIYQKIEISNTGNQTKLVLNNAVRQFIEDEVLAREGFKRKLNNLSTVKNDINIWRDYYLSLLLMENEAKNISINESELIKYEAEKNNLTDSLIRVNIIEILTNNVDDVETILNECQNGVEFEKLAQKYNLREATKSSGGEWGFMPVSRFGEIGKIALQMNTGDIYGPIKIPEGYSIFKLVEKNVDGTFTTDTLQENKDFLRLQLILQKMNSSINSKTVEYAVNYGISINENILNKLILSELNTFTYRLIGFGGKMTAFPLTTPAFEWFNHYEEKKELP